MRLTESERGELEERGCGWVLKDIEEKDDEIDRLSHLIDQCDNESEDQIKTLNSLLRIKDERIYQKDNEIDAFKQAHATALKTQLVLNSEIERLRDRLEEYYAKQTYKEWARNNILIRELADALEDANAFVSQRTYSMDEELWTRARDATRSGTLALDDPRRLPATGRPEEESQRLP